MHRWSLGTWACNAFLGQESAFLHRECPALWSVLLGMWLLCQTRVWEKGKDSGINKHLHSLMLHRHDHCRLNGSLWKFRQRKWSHYCTPAFFQVTGSLSGLDNLITYYGLCGGSLFKQGWNVLCWDIMFRLDMADNKLPKPARAIAKGTWTQWCLAMCLTAQSHVLFSKGVHSSLTPHPSFQWELTLFLTGQAPWGLLEAQTSALGQH